MSDWNIWLSASSSHLASNFGPLALWTHVWRRYCWPTIVDRNIVDQIFPTRIRWQKIGGGNMSLNILFVTTSTNSYNDNIYRQNVSVQHIWSNSFHENYLVKYFWRKYCWSNIYVKNHSWLNVSDENMSTTYLWR